MREGRIKRRMRARRERTEAIVEVTTLRSAVLMHRKLKLSSSIVGNVSVLLLLVRQQNDPSQTPTNHQLVVPAASKTSGLLSLKANFLFSLYLHQKLIDNHAGVQRWAYRDLRSGQRLGKDWPAKPTRASDCRRTTGVL